ncbi:hypothetical protein [Mesorhizobium sp. M0522]|uniref:hypothetical protein n=1 Tax=Mesorhizobium sp. M0522 TaxID=2956958 RepID=UPI00333643E9
MTLMLCAKATSFDDLWGELCRLQSICAQMAEPWQVETLAAEFDVVVAGVGSKGPAAYLVSNHGNHGFKPWEVFEIPYCLATPVIDQTLLESVFWADNPVAEMPRLVDSQRADPSVGGFAQLTSITAAGISTRIVRDYRSTFNLVEADAWAASACRQHPPTRPTAFQAGGPFPSKARFEELSRLEQYRPWVPLG